MSAASMTSVAATDVYSLQASVGDTLFDYYIDNFFVRNLSDNDIEGDMNRLGNWFAICLILHLYACCVTYPICRHLQQLTIQSHAN